MAVFSPGDHAGDDGKGPSCRAAAQSGARTMAFAAFFALVLCARDPSPIFIQPKFGYLRVVFSLWFVTGQSTRVKRSRISHWL